MKHMPPLDYATEVGIARERSIAGGVFGLFFAAGVGLIANGMAWDLLADLRYLDHRTEDLRRAHSAWMICNASLVAVLSAMTVSLVARSLRGALGLPPRRRHSFSARIAPYRILAGGIMWITLWSRGLSEYAFLRDDASPTGTLALGLVMCALFAFDVPLLVRNAIAALRARAPMLGARFVELDRLPSSGRVHVRARLASAYEIGTGAELRIEGAGGAPVLVELDPDRLIIVAELADKEGDDSGPQILAAGTEVRVIGELRGGADAYRVDRRIDGGRGKVHLYVGAATMTRRLLLAAAVELLAAVGLTACVLGMLGFFAYLGLRLASR